MPDGAATDKENAQTSLPRNDRRRMNVSTECLSADESSQSYVIETVPKRFRANFRQCVRLIILTANCGPCCSVLDNFQDRVARHRASPIRLSVSRPIEGQR